MKRRDFLTSSSAVLASLLSPQFASSALADISDNDQLATQAKPASVGHKFTADGQVRHFPGNGIICHIDKKSEAFMALLDINVLLERSHLLKRIVPLPPASYHMTVFEGVVDEVRKPGYWPDDLPLDASLEACNTLFANKLRGFDLASSIPFRMKPLPIEAQNKRETILLEPFDAHENEKLRVLRNRLSALLHLKQKNHDNYAFHITLNYLYDWPSDAESALYDQIHRQSVAMFIERSPIIDLQYPEFCLLEDMYEFKRQFYLQNYA